MSDKSYDFKSRRNDMNKMKCVVIGVLTVFLLLSCDAFLNNADGDLAKKLDEAVKEANAPRINVEIDTAGAGVASQPTGAKLDIPFTVDFTPYNDFSFGEWKAYLNSVVEGSELGADKVTFSNKNAAATAATVKTNPGAGKVILVPSGLDRPRVISVYPNKDIAYDNPYIQIRFSRALDPATVLFNTGWRRNQWGEPSWGEGDPQKLSTRFNNISIIDEISGSHLEPFLTPPYLSPDGRTLTFWAYTIDYQGDREGAESSFNNSKNQGSVTVDLGRGIKDVNGVAIVPYSFSYRTAASGMGLWKNPFDKPKIYQRLAAIQVKDYYPGSPLPLGKYAVAVGDDINQRLIPSDPQADNDIYIVFQCTEITDAPIIGLRVYERYYTGTPSIPNEYHDSEDLNDWPLLSDTDPVLAYKIAAAFLPIFRNNVYGDEIDPANPFYVVKYTLKERNIPSTGNSYSREVGLYVYPLTGYDTLIEANDGLYKKNLSSDTAYPQDNSGVSRKSEAPIRIRYYREGE
jgi:hypothetical protein